MIFVEIPTEQTTAVTDAVLGIAAILACRNVRSLNALPGWKSKVWSSLFVLLAGAALLGAIAHGIKMPDAVNVRIWVGLNLTLGLMLAAFVIAVVCDLFGEQPSRKFLPMIVGLALVFWGTTLLFPDSFLIFIVYEAAAMLFALCGYLWLGLKKTLSGAWWMAGGVAVSIAAALIQATAMARFRMVWEFDHNGVYHLVQLAGLAFFVVGLQKDLRGTTHQNP